MQNGMSVAQMVFLRHISIEMEFKTQAEEF
jgi:hypothetical protein